MVVSLPFGLRVTVGPHFIIEMVLGIIYVHINPSSTYNLFYQPPLPR